MRGISRYALPLFTLCIYVFLYVPIVVLILFSFNRSAYPYTWGGFSLHWYRELFQSTDLLHALYNSLIVACVSMVLSILLAVLFIFFRPKNKFNNLLPLFYGGLAAPEVVLAVGLLTLFYFLMVPLGLTTIIAGHTLVGLGYTIPIIQSRFEELDTRYTEASMDLGASQFQTLWRVIVPLLYPALIASGLLVFIVSLDDFVIAFFTSGAATQTLPMYIFSMIRSGATPVVNALSVFLLVISSLVVMMFSWLQMSKADMV